MASTYIPPNKRVIQNSQAFPALTVMPPPKNNAVEKPKFITMVHNLVSAEEQQALQEEEARLRRVRESVVVPVRFKNLHAIREKIRAEEAAKTEDVSQTEEPLADTVDDWQNVVNKRSRAYRRSNRTPRTPEEIAAQHEEEERLRKEQEDAWSNNGPETHETYWDERR